MGGYSAFDSKPFERRALGSFYTPNVVAECLINQILDKVVIQKSINTLTICDPFCGDGRLLSSIALKLRNRMPSLQIYIEGWDKDKSAIEQAEKKIQSLFSADNFVEWNFINCDSFHQANENSPKFKVVITNPPWETIKPDWRELKQFTDEEKNEIKSELRNLDNRLAENFPISQPSRKFAGWGTNLSRVGLELSLSILNTNGVLGIVMPSSYFADMTSQPLREHLFSNYSLTNVTYYPAEYRLFDQVDVEFATCIVVNSQNDDKLKFEAYSESGVINQGSIKRTQKTLSLLDGNLPIRLGAAPYKIFEKIQRHPSLCEINHENSFTTWGGREMDETRIKEKFIPKNGIKIMFSRDMERFGIRTETESLNQIPEHYATKSSAYPRIIWRDIARPSMKRRMNATVLEEGIITGNSLGVLHLGNCDEKCLLSLLGVMNSLVFEYQIRAKLATNHITWGVIRKLKIPSMETLLLNKVDKIVERIMQKEENEIELEALIAVLYGLNQNDFEVILNAYDRLTSEEKGKLILAFSKNSRKEE